MKRIIYLLFVFCCLQFLKPVFSFEKKGYTVNMVIFAGGKFHENVRQALHLGVIFAGITFGCYFCNISNATSIAVY